jgi:hypothetical protein
MHGGGWRIERTEGTRYKNNSILIVLSIPLYSLPLPLFTLASEIKI